jgi:hypothetical protein
MTVVASQTKPRRAANMHVAAPKAGESRPAKSGLASRLSENLTVRRLVLSGSSVWLSVGGGLTLYSPVGLLWSDRPLPCRPPPPRIRQRDLIGAWHRPN